MKHALLICSLLFMTAMIPGCKWLNPPAEKDPPGIEVAAASMQPIRSFFVENGSVTLTNADTVDLALGTYASPIAYQWQSSWDSISGSTAGNCYLELDSDNDGLNFYRLETLVINGVTSRLYETGTLLGGTLRCRCISTGTQVTNGWNEFHYSPRLPN